MGPGHVHDVYTLDGATVARATDRGGWTIVMGTREAGVTLGAGSPFFIDRGTTLNTFFNAPYDGTGSFADSGFHLGRRLALPHGVPMTLVFDQAFGTSLTEAETAFLLANPR
jgi:hypothetical protein